jgi:hypothetical protein
VGISQGLTLMRSPVVKRQLLPRSGLCPVCFRWSAGRASFASGNVFCLHVRLWVPQCGGTTHVSRLCRHTDGDCRAISGEGSAASQPLRPLLPASTTAWRHGMGVSPCGAGSGAGQHPATACDQRRRDKSRRGRPLTGPGAEVRLRGQCRKQDRALGEAGPLMGQ